METRQYIVSLKEGIDYNRFWEEMESFTVSVPHIPNRPVDIVNDRTTFDRLCEYALTDSEATLLRQDPRVLGVDIPLEHRNDIVIGFGAVEQQNFTKPSGTQTSIYSTGTNVNWGLIRHSNPTNVYGTGNSTSLNYNYTLDGTGVDVVIMDSGIQADHPEFQYVGNSTSRVQQINWASYVPALSTMGNSYQDNVGHGTQVAGIAVGKTFGWAKGAQIFSIKYATTGGGAALDVLEAIRLWHLSKGPNGRPTVLNMSVLTVYPYTIFGNTPASATNNLLANITSINWQGTTYPGNTNVTSRGVLLNSSNVACLNSIQNGISAVVSSYRVATEGLVSAGIVICKCADNNSYKIDIPGGIDYNNYITVKNYPISNVVYQQGDSFTTTKSIVVGSINVTPYSANQDQRATYSCAGPGVDIYAAGTYIMSAGTSDPAATDYAKQGNYFLNTAFKQYNDNGTSQATPQIAGMAALYIQANPFANNLNPNNCSQVKSWVASSATNTMYSPGTATTYMDFTSTLGGNAGVAYQPIQGVTQVKNNAGQWQPVQAVKVKTATNTWSNVRTVWTKVDLTTWKQIF